MYSLYLFIIVISLICRSQWPRGLRRRSAAAPTGSMDVCLLWVLCCLRRADHSSRGGPGQLGAVTPKTSIPYLLYFLYSSYPQSAVFQVVSSHSLSPYVHALAAASCLSSTVWSLNSSLRMFYVNRFVYFIMACPIVYNPSCDLFMVLQQWNCKVEIPLFITFNLQW